MLEVGGHESENGVQGPAMAEVGYNDGPHGRGKHDLEPWNWDLDTTVAT